MFWCASSTDGDDDGDTREERWESITNHIINKHKRHNSPLFPRCMHGRLRGQEKKKKWLEPGKQRHEILVYVSLQSLIE